MNPTKQKEIRKIVRNYSLAEIADALRIELMRRRPDELSEAYRKDIVEEIKRIRDAFEEAEI